MTVALPARTILIAALLMAAAPRALAGVSVDVSVRVGPPALPVYDQPPCPAAGYVWTPGYWAWDDQTAGYYWVPGTWVEAPVGMLWTPGWWGWSSGLYVWHAGYWGPHVGFYGGINYGHGYTGSGYWGGSWRGNVFYYNRAVTNVNVTHVSAVYNQTVVVRRASTASYNGGPNGATARPTPQEATAMRAPHGAALPAQAQHQQSASQSPQLYARANRGVPPVAATAHPAELTGHAVVAARAPGAAFTGVGHGGAANHAPATAHVAHAAALRGERPARTRHAHPHHGGGGGRHHGR
jgi:hypothetical protein